jgi:hypothetical protein
MRIDTRTSTQLAEPAVGGTGAKRAVLASEAA